MICLCFLCSLQNNGRILILFIEGAAWCMKYNKSRNKLAIGTEEGFVCIFDVTPDGLNFDKILDKQEGRVLSLDWHVDGFHIVTGSTGSLLIFEL